MDSDYAELLSEWGVEFASQDASAEIEGSPERTAARAVVFDTAGKRWILEKIEPDNLARKQEVAEQLATLSGLTQVHPYQKTAGGSFFSDRHMLRPFIDGVSLNRETYLNDSWRIDAMTDFLIQFRGVSAPLSGPRFSIGSYAENRMKVWRTRHPERTKKLEDSFARLKETFLPMHDQLPVAFCHGDYHPLNIVWGEGAIQSVIDWEFCGTKPELYDAALLLGCIGFEDPDNLLKEPSIRLVQNLRKANFGAPVSWEHLLGLMATIRWGWMSEWIRRGENDAAEMETLYIQILVDQQDYIQQRWL